MFFHFLFLFVFKLSTPILAYDAAVQIEGTTLGPQFQRISGTGEWNMLQYQYWRNRNTMNFCSQWTMFSKSSICLWFGNQMLFNENEKLCWCPRHIWLIGPFWWTRMLWKWWLCRLSPCAYQMQIHRYFLEKKNYHVFCTGNNWIRISN